MNNYRLSVVNCLSHVILVCDIEHPSGCADGNTEGLADYEEIQACQGRWKGHVRRAKSLCAAGWQVCSPRHSSSLRLLSWSDVTDKLDGCYAYNAANTLNLCSTLVSSRRICSFDFTLDK